MEEFQFIFMLEFWHKIFNEFEKTLKSLQNSEVTISTTSNLYSYLAQLVQTFRDNFDNIESAAKEKLPDVDYKSATTRRRKRKKQVNDGNAIDADETLSPRDKFRIQSFYPMVDALSTNLEKRSKVYSEISEIFSCFPVLNVSLSDIQKGIDSLKEKYSEDVQEDFAHELDHFHLYVKKHHSEKRNISHEMLYEIIVCDKIDVAFPNVEAILRLFLSLMVTNCTGERSFSKLRRIKNYLRTTMSQERLTDLTILCMEYDILRSLNFDDIIEKFSLSKARKSI